MSSVERKRDIVRRQLERIRFARTHNISHDRDLARQQLVMPSILSFEINYHETATALIALRDAVLGNNTSVMLHFEHVVRIDPSAALALVAEVYRCRNLRPIRDGHSVHGNYPRSIEVHTLLKDMGFYNLLHVDPSDRPILTVDTSGPVYLKFLTGTNVDGELINWFIDLIEKNQILEFDGLARTRLVAAILEAMGNANEHAYKKPTQRPAMKRRWFLSASLHPINHEVTVMLYDQGIGIPSTIEVSFFDKFIIQAEDRSWLDLVRNKPNDGVMIKAATELFRTGTSQPGRGRGFRNMKRLIDHCEDGALKVLSNFGFYSYIRGSGDLGAATENFDARQSSLEGTLLEWNFKSTARVVMNDE
jgi:hypothetical protein